MTKDLRTRRGVKVEGVAPVGVVHPGAMGSAVGAALRADGSEVLWASDGRSAETRQRAAADGLADVGELATLAERAELIVSVCPPHAAVEVARDVLAAGFGGLYVDANAVAPATARRISTVVVEGGARFVDGGIVGRPARQRGTTRLFLSGDDAAAVAQRFAAGPFEVVVVDGGPGAASAVKAGYAGWTKGSSALLMAVRALARREGVEEVLLAEWERSHPDLPGRSEGQAAGAHRKAWRFAGEMREIATALADAGLPDGFHLAAADLYDQLADLKDDPGDKPVADVLDRL